VSVWCCVHGYRGTLPTRSGSHQRNQGIATRALFTRAFDKTQLKLLLVLSKPLQWIKTMLECLNLFHLLQADSLLWMMLRVCTRSCHAVECSV